MSQAGSLTGWGVTFFITGTNGGSAPKAAGPINESGGGPLSLSAPSSGPYRGLLFYQDPNVTYAGANSFTQGGSDSDTGTFYFPTTALDFTGGGASSATAIVAHTVTFTGGGNVSIAADTTGQRTGLVTNVARLIQ